MSAVPAMIESSSGDRRQVFQYCHCGNRRAIGGTAAVGKAGVVARREMFATSIKYCECKAFQKINPLVRTS